MAEKPEKPEKPTADFPLFAHASGQWAKKIGGKTKYFGSWADPEAAEQSYLASKSSLPANGKPCTIKEVCNEIVHAQKSRVASGDISPRTLYSLESTCKRMMEFLGHKTSVDGLRAADFNRFREKLAAQFGPARLTGEVGRVKQIFIYAVAVELIDRLPRFGPYFTGASPKAKRLLRIKKGERSWSAAELRLLIDAADFHFKPLLLLAINCGFGQTDLSNLTLSAVNFNTGWIRFPRPKTGVQRNCPLWPETIAALQTFIEHRGKHAGPVFLTRNAMPLIQFYPATGGVKDVVTLRFRALCKRISISRPGVGFYGIRHTFQTVADGCRDFVAVRHIMGHAEDRHDMSAAYRESIEPDRLVAAAEHVRGWLWPEKCSAAVE